MSGGINYSGLNLAIYRSIPTILTFFMAMAKIFQRVWMIHWVLCNYYSKKKDDVLLTYYSRNCSSIYPCFCPPIPKPFMEYCKWHRWIRHDLCSPKAWVKESQIGLRCLRTVSYKYWWLLSSLKKNVWKFCRQRKWEEVFQEKEIV